MMTIDEETMKLLENAKHHARIAGLQDAHAIVCDEICDNPTGDRSHVLAAISARIDEMEKRHP